MDSQLLKKQNTPYKNTSKKWRKKMEENKTNQTEWEKLDNFLNENDPDTNMKFGIELEYGGYDNRLSCVQNPIIETIKDDGSVSGDGTEYNLKPIQYEDFANGTFAAAIESFMCKAANKNCTESATAGQHIHYSYKNIDPHDGDRIREIMSVVRNNFGYTYVHRQLNETISVTKKDGTENEQSRIITPRIKAYHDAIQWLYSVSNRAGTEDYGLGGDYTRGYTRHGTLELRCWRTTLDFRSVICRVIVGWFYIKWALKTQLIENGKTEDEVNWEELDIWKLMKKDEKVFNAYKYLAFNVNNRHRVGLSERDLQLKLGTLSASAIKARSRMYQRALLKGTDEWDAKDLFKKITRTEE